MIDKIISLFYVLASASALYISMRCHSFANENKLSILEVVLPIVFGPFYIAYKLGIDEKCHKLFSNDL